MRRLIPLIAVLASPVLAASPAPPAPSSASEAAQAPAPVDDARNPLIGAWTRAPAPAQDWEDGDPRQQLTFTDDRMVIGLGDGIALRRYEVHRTFVRAESRGGQVYAFRITGRDRMCMVPAWAPDRASEEGPARCYVRRRRAFDATLV